MITNKEYLKAIFDNAKSFYKKAILKRIDNKIILQSYNTNILILADKKIKFCCESWAFTLTTCRHIKEFLKQFTNITATTKKDILNLFYNNK